MVSNANAEVTKRARVALVGANGQGKSSLLALLRGLVHADHGHLQTQAGLRIGYVPQHHLEQLPIHVSPTEFLSSKYSVTHFEARSRLGKFGISGSASLQSISSLSGGQRVRVSLTCITWHASHLLLLDEPTNHLDQPSIMALAAALRHFQGAIITVSHNRDFLAACCEDLWVLHGGQLMVFQSTEHVMFTDILSDYIARGCSAVAADGGVSVLAGVMNSSSSSSSQPSDSHSLSFHSLLPKNTSKSKKFKQN